MELVIEGLGADEPAGGNPADGKLVADEAVDGDPLVDEPPAGASNREGFPREELPFGLLLEEFFGIKSCNLLPSVGVPDSPSPAPPALGGGGSPVLEALAGRSFNEAPEEGDNAGREPDRGEIPVLVVFAARSISEAGDEGGNTGRDVSEAFGAAGRPVPPVGSILVPTETRNVRMSFTSAGKSPSIWSPAWSWPANVGSIWIRNEWPPEGSGSQPVVACQGLLADGFPFPMMMRNARTSFNRGSRSLSIR